MRFFRVRSLMGGSETELGGSVIFLASGQCFSLLFCRKSHVLLPLMLAGTRGHPRKPDLQK